MTEGFAASVTTDICPQCGSPVALTDIRCLVCGMTMAGQSGRSGPFSRRTWWFTLIGFTGVYLGTLAIVAITR